MGFLQVCNYRCHNRGSVGSSEYSVCLLLLCLWWWFMSALAVLVGWVKKIAVCEFGISVVP